jgi:hypothetical protein
MKEYVGKNTITKLIQLIIDALPSKELSADETTELWNSINAGSAGTTEESANA